VVQISIGSIITVFSEKNYQIDFLCTNVAYAIVARSHIPFLIDAGADKVVANISGLIVSIVSIVKRYTSLTLNISK